MAFDKSNDPADPNSTTPVLDPKAKAERMNVKDRQAAIEAAAKVQAEADKKDRQERQAEKLRREAFDAAHPPQPFVPGTEEYQARINAANASGHPVTEGGDIPEPILVTPSGRVVENPNAGADKAIAASIRADRIKAGWPAGKDLEDDTAEPETDWIGNVTSTGKAQEEAQSLNPSRDPDPTVQARLDKLNKSK